MRDLSLTPDLLLHAYASGVFPMAESRDDPEVFWVDPRHRGLIPLDGFHISRSLARTIRRGQFLVTVNQAFDAVVEACADRPETWINPTILDLYSELHAQGDAHSLEVWDGQTLAGGVYGVALGAAFFGESMFSRRTDASKLALAYLVDRLRQGEFRLFDVQFLTPHLASLGAIEVSRTDYRGRLADALQGTPGDFAAVGKPPDAQLLMQRMTQTS
ncbi:MAG: leucyl/phenylalanyl-tRNA--protein transferase [Pseudomonadota bacterium]